MRGAKDLGGRLGARMQIRGCLPADEGALESLEAKCFEEGERGILDRLEESRPLGHRP